jgi:hypothetical protein
MNWEEIEKLNNAIASLHSENDASSLTIDKKRRIKFPRGYLRPFNFYRDFFPYIKDSALLTRIVSHLMHRDTLHWLWLKTDIAGDARCMIIKFQLITFASVLEGIVKYLEPKTPKGKDNMYYRIDQLQGKGLISNAKELKQLWADRNSIHLHLDKFEKSPVEYTDSNYKLWHKAIKQIMFDLKANI